MTTGQIIWGSRPASLLMRRIWFNCNRVFNRFEFIFSIPRRVRDRFRYCYSHPVIIFYYFILYFNINNNNN